MTERTSRRRRAEEPVLAGVGPRFALEAGFIILVAVVAGLLKFDIPAIVLVMGLAWALVATVEWAFSRQAAGMRAARDRAVAPPSLDEAPAPPAAESHVDGDATSAIPAVAVEPWPSEHVPGARPAEAPAGAAAFEDAPAVDEPTPAPVEDTGAEQDAAPPLVGEHLDALAAHSGVEPPIALERDASPEPLEVPEPVEVPQPPELPDSPELPESPELPDSPAVAGEPAAIEPVAEEPAAAALAGVPAESAQGSEGDDAEATAPEEAEERRPPLVAVPTPPAIEAKPEPEPVRDDRVVEFPQTGRQQWNLWELERLARDRAGDDPARDEEWGYLLVYLREFANPDGLLAPDFDGLVRESFADLIGVPAAR